MPIVSSSQPSSSAKCGDGASRSGVLLVHSSLQMRAFCANERFVSCSKEMKGCEYEQDRMN